MKDFGMKDVGIFLIIAQIISYIGNITAGNFYVPPLSATGISYFLGQNLMAIIGIALILFNPIDKKKAASPNTEEKVSEEKTFHKTLDGIDDDSNKE